MTAHSNHSEAVELLQELGLKEYEAKSFVALSRLPEGTAKEISEVSEVPRTRIYDAIKVLEKKGLVETQHSSPQRFRAVPVDEAIRTLRLEYEDRIESLRSSLDAVDEVEVQQGEETTDEVWTLSGADAVANRTVRLVEGAEEEVILVLGRADLFTDRLSEELRDGHQRDVLVAVGTIDDELREIVEAVVPGVEVYVSGLDWLAPSELGDDTEIGRLLLVDRTTILVSSLENGEAGEERAVIGRGFHNGIVAVLRRLMATGQSGALSRTD